MPSKICMEFPIATHCSLRSLLKFWWSIYVSSDYSSKIVVFLISGSNWVIEIDPLGLCFEICITLEVNHIVKIFKIKVVSVLVFKRGNWPLHEGKQILTGKIPDTLQTLFDPDTSVHLLQILLREQSDSCNTKVVDHHGLNRHYSFHSHPHWTWQV